MAIDVDLLLIFLSLGLSGALMSRRLPPEVRSRAVDTWLGVGLSAALAWKLAPLVFDPTLIGDPLRLFVLTSGDVGLFLGGAAGLTAFFILERRRLAHGDRAGVFRVFEGLMTVLIAAYGLHGLMLVMGDPSTLWPLWRFFIGAGLIAAVAARRSHGLCAHVVLAAGSVIVVESFHAYRLYFGLSPLQWGAALGAVVYLLLAVWAHECGSARKNGPARHNGSE